MVNDEHVAMLKKGVDAWNEWRDDNPDIRPDLFEADLSRRVGRSPARPQQLSTTVSRSDLDFRRQRRHYFPSFRVRFKSSRPR